MPAEKKQQTTPPTDEPKGTTTVVTSKVPATVVSAEDRQRALDTLRPSEGQSAISIPRIVALQALSSEVTREEDKLKPGLLFNRLTKEVVGENGKKLTFIPIMYFPQRIRIILGAGLRCRSINLRTAQMMGGEDINTGEPTNKCDECRLKDWPRDRIARGEKIDEEKARRGPECSLTENFPALMVTGDNPDDYELIVLSFQRTSIQAAKDLKGNHAISGKPWYTNRYELVVIRAMGGPGGKQEYFKQEVRRAGKASADEIRRAEQMLQFLAGKDISTDLGEEPEGAVPDDTAKKETGF